MTELWRCDDCGGPAAWTFIDGEPHYSCRHRCEGFMADQLDLWLFKRQVDGSGSVSAVEAAKGLRHVSEIMRSESDDSDLPF